MFHTADILVILIIICLILWAIRTIYHNRKNGSGCTGCPHAESCSKRTCTGKK